MNSEHLQESTVKMDSKFTNKTLQDYEVLSVIGNGCFGTCYKVRDKETGEMFAWKGVDYDELDGTSKEALTREINVLRQLQHPNIVQYYHHLINTEAKSIFIVMECCEGGDLAQLIGKARTDSKRFEERYIWRVLFQLCKALQLCHTRLREGTLLHRDIKPANIFLDAAGNAKLGDFGLARMLRGSDEKFAQTIVGTPYYMSPELVRGVAYDRSSDVWALGCLIYELCSLRPPFRGRDCTQLSVNIASGKFSHIPTIYSIDLQAIINCMLAVENEQRPGIEVISRHPVVVRNITDLGSEFPRLVEIEHENFYLERSGEGDDVRCKLQYSPIPNISSTCSRLSVSGVFTPDLRTELFSSAKRRIFSTVQRSDPELYESIRQEDSVLAAGQCNPVKLTQSIFDEVLQSRLHSIRVQESLLKQREHNLNAREMHLSQWEKRLQEKERELLNRSNALSSLSLPVPQPAVVPVSRPRTVVPPPIPPRKPNSHDDTYCSIEPNDSLMHSPTMAKLNLAALSAPKAFPIIRKVTFQSPKKFISYDIENQPPRASQSASISSKSSNDSNETTSTQHRRKSLLSSIFGLHRSSSSSKDSLPRSTTAKKAPQVAIVSSNTSKKSSQVVSNSNSKCQTTELSTIWTKEHKRAAFDLLAAMNAAERCDTNFSARHKLRHSVRDRNLQRNRLRRSLVVMPPPSNRNSSVALPTRDHIIV